MSEAGIEKIDQELGALGEGLDTDAAEAARGARDGLRSLSDLDAELDALEPEGRLEPEETPLPGDDTKMESAEVVSPPGRSYDGEDRGRGSKVHTQALELERTSDILDDDPADDPDAEPPPPPPSPYADEIAAADIVETGTEPAAVTSTGARPIKKGEATSEAGVDELLGMLELDMEPTNADAPGEDEMPTEVIPLNAEPTLGNAAASAEEANPKPGDPLPPSNIDQEEETKSEKVSGKKSLFKKLFGD